MESWAEPSPQAIPESKPADSSRCEENKLNKQTQSHFRNTGR
jgi:hypothetical protein